MAARLIGALAVIALAATARAETRPGYGGAITATLAGEPAAIDPAAARSHAEITIAGLLFDTLYRTTADGAVVPHLAAGPPEIAERRARIALRAGVRFHDGGALGAADVVASLGRVRAGEAGWLLAPVTAIDAEGDALVLTLGADVAPAELAALLAAPQTAIVPGGKAPAARAPVGSGPFRVDTIDRRRRRIVLTAWDEHFAGRPYVDRLELRWYADGDDEPRAFEDGKLHLSARGAAVFAGAQPKYKSDVAEAPATLLTFVGFGRAQPKVTGDVDFRRALHLALARSGLSSSGRGERVAPTADPIPADLGGEPLAASMRAGDLDAARRALERAGERVAALAPRRRGALSLEILVDRTRLDDREVAERVVRALDKLGLAATITELDAAELVTRVARGDGDLWIGQLAAPGTTPPLLWGAVFAAGGDRWVERRLAAGDLDPARARAEFAARLPILPLLHRAVRLHHRADVRGVGFDASARPTFADLFFFGEPARSRRKAR